MIKLTLFDGIVFSITLIFNIFTAITTNKMIIHNRMLSYTIFYITLGIIYPFFHKAMIGKNILLGRGILKLLSFIVITQIISYSIYFIKTEAYKYGDCMGFIIFLSFFGYSILITSVFYFLGYLIRKLFKLE